MNLQNLANKKVDYLKITDAATNAILNKIKEDDTAFGLKVGIKTKGCSGMAYNLEFANKDSVNE